MQVDVCIIVQDCRVKFRSLGVLVASIEKCKEVVTK